MKRNLFLLVVAALIVMLPLTGCQKEKDVLAVVNGEEMRREELEHRLALETFLNPNLDGDSVETEALLDQLIVEKLLLADGLAMDLSVDKEELKKFMEAVKSQLELFYGSGEDYEKALEEKGITEEDVENYGGNLLLIEDLYKMVTKHVTVGDAEVEAFYRENPDMFTVGERVKARHILVDEEELAEELLARAQEGEDFAQLAQEYSQDPGSQGAGGDLDYFPRGMMVEEFEEAAFGAKVGEIVGVVETIHGYHIIKVEDKKEKEILPLEGMEENIREYLLEGEKSSIFYTYLEDLKNSADIERF
ncbi:MAG: hypothetical protein GX349_00370 [Firmicutes bacterium]|nr:hypothetical protein [Bacillota bacterium]